MAKPDDIIEQLRKSIDTMGVSRYRISKETGVEQSVLSRFVRTEAAMSMAAFAKICDFLGLRLEQTGKPKFTPSKPRKRKGK